MPKVAGDRLGHDAPPRTAAPLSADAQLDAQLKANELNARARRASPKPDEEMRQVLDSGAPRVSQRSLIGPPKLIGTVPVETPSGSARRAPTPSVKHDAAQAKLREEMDRRKKAKASGSDSHAAAPTHLSTPLKSGDSDAATSASEVQSCNIRMDMDSEFIVYNAASEASTEHD